MITELPKAEALVRQVFSINTPQAFQHTALTVFQYQYCYNAVYQLYCKLVGRTPDVVKAVEDIPFLPISFFKTHAVTSGSFTPALLFESSGTTGVTTSRHLVKDEAIYRQSFRQAFKFFYGPADKYCILGLLPSYLERSTSSLVYMVNDLITQSKHPASGFYLYDHNALAQNLKQLEAQGQPTLLFGVTYALLDFAAQYPMPLHHTTIIETGGMKGRKKELLRTQVHEVLKKSFSLPGIHSEYGMTELLSQAYAIEEGRFYTPAWTQALVREEDDPFALHNTAKTGGLNIIDLANMHSCSFIATEDIARLHADGSFEVMGRLDNTDIRGCSLLSL